MTSHDDSRAHRTSAPAESGDGGLESRLDAVIDRNASDAEQLLAELVAVRSVNPLFPGIDGQEYAGGEALVNELLSRRFSSLGMETHDVAVDEARPNLVAVRRGAGGGRSLALNGHVDTVAPGRESERLFPDPWQAEVRDGVMFGLGASDMKAGHAAMWLAMSALAETGTVLAGDVQLHCVVGEETMSHELGTSAVLDAGFRIDGALVLEGTSSSPRALDVSNAAAGNYLFHVTVPGLASHWSARNQAIRAGGLGDEIGVNAIDKAFYVYQAMRQLEEQWAFTKTHPAFAPGTFTIHPGVLRADIGTESPAYFPDRARFDYLLSFPPGEDSATVAAEVEAHIHGAAQLDPWLREHPVEFDWEDTWPPAYTDPRSPFADAVLSARNDWGRRSGAGEIEAPVTLAAQTDASFYEAVGIPALVCGPGDLRFAHSASEQVDLAMVPAAAKLIVRTALAWCGLAPTDTTTGPGER
jgi:acetylornithine deacetylase/succinyl-diaminopimelate desuccinylase-like protein